MLAKLKSYYIVLSSLAIGLLWLLLSQSRDKAQEAQNEAERNKINRELDKLFDKAHTTEEAADEAYKSYKQLLDKHPDLLGTKRSSVESDS